MVKQRGTPNEYISVQRTWREMRSKCHQEVILHGGQWPGFGMPVRALLPPGSLWPQVPSLGLSLLACHRVLQRPVGHSMIKPLQINAGTRTRGAPTPAFKGSWQAALLRA